MLVKNRSVMWKYVSQCWCRVSEETIGGCVLCDTVLYRGGSSVTYNACTWATCSGVSYSVYYTWMSTRSYVSYDICHYFVPRWPI